MTPKFLVSMIGMNRCAGTREAVEAVLRQSEPLHLVLTNNGSSDGTGAYFDEVRERLPENVTVFHEKENTFFQSPNNRAFRMAAQMGIPYFVLQNDDAILPDNGLAMLAQPLDNSPYSAISGPEGGCCHLDHNFHGCPGILEYIEGSCACIKVELVRRHRENLFWDQLHSIYSEDSELSLFMREKGYTIHGVPFHLPHARSQTVNRTPEVKALCDKAQRENHEKNKARWSYYLSRRRFDFPILVKRKYAIGDVLLTAPIIRAIKKSNPLSPIWVETDYPELFERNPNVERAEKKIEATNDALVVDLNDSYESTTSTHILEAYESTTRKAVTGIGEISWITDLTPSTEDMKWADYLVKLKCDGQDVALVNIDNGNWPGKNWDQSRFTDIIKSLESSGWAVLRVGSKSPFTERTTIHQLAALCSRASLMISTDSFPMHCAQAMGCPTIGLFGVTRSRYISTHGSRFIAVESPEDMTNSGMRHKRTGVTHINEGRECMDAITVDMVLDAVRRISQ